MNIEREARENIRREVSAYPGAEVQFYRHNGEILRAVIRWHGKSREVRFRRTSHQPHVMRAIISDTRREMRDLGIIPRDRAREPLKAAQVGVIGAKLLDAVKKAAPEAFAPPPPPPHPPPEPEIDVGGPEDEGDDYNGYFQVPQDTGPLCPDEIAARRHQPSTAFAAVPPQPKETKTMTQLAEASLPFPPDLPKSNGNGHAQNGKPVKMSHTDVVAATKLLLKHGSVGPGGIYTYVDGWGDERVRAESNTAATVQSIIKLRRDPGNGFGRLATERKVPPLAEADRLTALEKQIDDLKKRLDAVGA